MPNSTTATLNRWLDRTPRGALTRTRNYVTIPAFHIVTPWNGISDIVGIYDYASPNRFSLRNLAGLPLLPTNYTLVISYVNQNRTVVRYRLISGMGENILFTIPPYSGQMIKPNFRIEIWSCPGFLASQATDITLMTTVLNAVDYRNGVDTQLVAENLFSTSFGAKLNGTNTSDMPEQTNMNLWFDAGGIVDSTPPNVDTWTDSKSGWVLAPSSGVPTLRTFGYVTGVQTLGTAVLQGTHTILQGQHIYVALFGPITQNSNNNIILFTNGAVTIFQLKGLIPPTGNFNNTQLNSNAGSFKFARSGSIVLEYNQITGVVNVFDWATGALLGTTTLAANNVVGFTRVTLGDVAGLAGAGNIVARVLCYSQPQADIARNQTLQYLVGTPLLFPYTPVLNAS